MRRTLWLGCVLMASTALGAGQDGEVPRRRSTAAAYWAVKPPSTTSVDPVAKLERSLAR